MAFVTRLISMSSVAMMVETVVLMNGINLLLEMVRVILRSTMKSVIMMEEIAALTMFTLSIAKQKLKQKLTFFVQITNLLEMVSVMMKTTMSYVSMMQEIAVWPISILLPVLNVNVFKNKLLTLVQVLQGLLMVNAMMLMIT